MVRAQVLRLVSLPLWHALSPGRLQLELHAHEALAKHWKAAAKKEAKAAAKKAKKGEEGGEGGSYVPVTQRPETRFLPALMDEFLAVLDQVGAGGGRMAGWRWGGGMAVGRVRGQGRAEAGQGVPREGSGMP